MAGLLGRRTAVWAAVGITLVLALYGAYVVRIAAGRAGSPPALTAGFAGSAACAECHPEISAQHAATPHARALRAITDPDVTASLPEPEWVRDPQTGTAYRIAARDGQPGVEAEAGSTSHWQPLHWAFGSGTQARTLVGRAADGSYVEAPLSVYRSAGWDYTPGFLGIPPDVRSTHPTGKKLSAVEVMDCFHCHATGARSSASEVRLEGAQFGVQCESCHGPARAHVEAARQGRPKEGVTTAGLSSGQSMVTFCASCHRDSPPPGLKKTDPVVIRFAPVGFQESACFRKSGGKFSCISCHDPHGTSSKDPEQYRKVCASCHTGSSDQRSCPVQPQGDCVSCHMPKQIVQRNCVFTDHWIRAPRRKTASDGSSRTAKRDIDLR